MADQSNKQVVVATQPTMDRNLSTERMAFFNDDGSPLLVVDATVPPWAEPTLLTGWDEMGPASPTRPAPRYYKDPTGTVWVEVYTEVVVADYLAGFSTPIFTLPEDHRPDSLAVRGGIWTTFATAPEYTVLMISATGEVMAPSPSTFAFEDPLPEHIYLVSGFSFRANP
jgi:hypothetical protein